jgi:hypothetical protein
MLVSSRAVKDKTAGSVPIAFPGIRPLIRLVSVNTQLDEMVTLVLIRFRCFQITMRKRRRYHPSVTFKSFRISVSLKYCTRPLTYCLSFSFLYPFPHPLLRDVGSLILAFIFFPLLG